MVAWRKLAQRSWPDYICTVCLFFMTMVLRRTMGYTKRLLDQAVIEELGYPLKPMHVPDWVLGTFGWIIPLMVIIVGGIFGPASAFKTHQHSVSYLNAYFSSAFISIAARRLGAVLEDVLGDFDTNFIVSPYTTAFEPQCTGEEDEINFGYTSFPSSQASIGTTSGMYAMLYLVHLWGVFRGKGRVYQAVLSLVPLILGLWLSILPFTSYAVHGTDVAAGIAIGAFIGAFFFYQAHSWPDELEAETSGTAEPVVNAAANQQEHSAHINSAAAPEEQLQMRDMYAAAEIAKAGKENPFA